MDLGTLLYWGPDFSHQSHENTNSKASKPQNNTIDGKEKLSPFSHFFSWPTTSLQQLVKLKGM
jgi:hypothetical protein